MQKRLLSVLAATITAAVLFSSCSKDNKQGRHIPLNAGIVVHLNGESLNSKLPWDEIKKTDLFKKAAADTTIPPFLKAIMDNPDNAGINSKSDIEFFMVKDSSGAYMGIEGSITDQAKFKQLLTNAPKTVKETSKDGITYITDEKVSIGYNKDMFIATVNLPEMAMMNNYTPMSTDTTFGMKEVSYDRDMSKVTASLFDIKEGASLAKNDHFSDLMGTKGDAHFWYSAQFFNMANNMGAMSAFADTKKLTDGAEFAGTLNFEDGKITFDGKSYGSKELTEIYKKYSGDSFDKTMVKNIPSKNLAGMMIINFKPEGIREILKLMNMDGLASIGLAQAGLNMDDLIKATKGDIMVSVTDIKPESDTVSKEKAQVVFATSIGDKAAFNKLIDAGKKYAPMLSAMNKDMDASGYAMNDKYFAMSNMKATADTWLSGTANNSFSFMDDISGVPFGGFIDFQYIFRAMKPNTNNDSLDLIQYDLSSKMFDNAKLSGGNFKDGGITQHWELNLMDKKTNSLKQLNSYASAMGMIEEQKRAKREEMWKLEEEHKSDDFHTLQPPPPPAQ